MSFDRARQLITEGGAEIMGERPGPGRENTGVEYQLWQLRLEMQQYAYALVTALESRD